MTRDKHTRKTKENLLKSPNEYSLSHPSISFCHPGVRKRRNVSQVSDAVRRHRVLVQQHLQDDQTGGVPADRGGDNQDRFVGVTRRDGIMLEIGRRSRVHSRVGRARGRAVEANQIGSDERGEDQSSAGRLDEDASHREEGPP